MRRAYCQVEVVGLAFDLETFLFRAVSLPLPSLTYIPISRAISNYGDAPFVGFPSFMSRFHQTVWLFITLSVIYAFPSQRELNEQQSLRLGSDLKEPFWRNVTTRQKCSVKTTRVRPLWHKSSSQLQQRNPDAVSIHVDPSHLWAWTPIKLGGLSALLLDSRGTTDMDAVKVQQLGVMLDIGSTQLYFLPSIPTRSNII